MNATGAVRNPGPYVPPTVDELCALANYSQAAKPLIAAGVDAQTLRELLLSERRTEFMDGIVAGVPVAAILELHRAPSSAVVRAAEALALAGDRGAIEPGA